MRPADACAQSAIGRRAMRDSRAGRGEPSDRRVVQVHPMRQPDVVTQPAKGVEILDRRAAEVLRAVLVLFGRLGQVRVQAHLGLARQLRCLGEKLACYREGRAGRQPDAQHRLRRSVVELLDGGLAGSEDSVAVFHHLVGRQPAGARAEIHGTARRVKAQADLPRGGNSRTEQVAARSREDVVMIHRGRAAGPGQPGECGGGQSPDDAGVHPGPDRG